MKKYVKYIFFPLVFIYWEIAFKFFTGKGITTDIIYPIFSAVTLGGIVAILTSFLPKVWNRVIGYTVLGIGCVLFCVHIVYYDIFKTAFTFALVFGGSEAGNAVTQFAGNTVTAIIDNILGLILCILPIAVAILLDIKLAMFEKMNKFANLISAAAVIAVYALSIVVVSISGSDGYTAKKLYFEEYVKDIAFERLGVLTSTRIDIKQLIFGVKEELSEIDKVQEMPSLPGVDTGNNENPTGSGDGEQSTEGEEIPEPIVYEPNVLNIDFDAFTSGESGDYIEWLNEFYSASTPTMQNEYTGMFEGYNLILITAESFSPWAVDEKYTPTLYKLVNEGFVFDNFYTPAFNNTTMGEWTVCTGLLPNGMGGISFDNTVSNGHKYMGMCMGNILGDLGYSTWAYHDHTYSYYNRDETHPNMGYDSYKGVGNGLNIKEVWPESDLEMMQASVDDYINDEQFHTYYMTVSGHLNYSWIGNSMSYKNKDLVADMDATEMMKAYMACNIELDRALEYLIGRLEEKGIADKTVIAMACDHYPYAMEEELKAQLGAEKTEFYGLYESNLVLWSASIEEPIHVSKVCSTIDIIPTLCNLMGIEYDSRLYSGKDILSDTPGLVIFSDMGFATDYCIYNATTGNIKATTDAEITDEYFDAVQSLAKNIWNASGRIILSDYYAKLKNYIKE